MVRKERLTARRFVLRLVLVSAGLVLAASLAYLGFVYYEVRRLFQTPKEPREYVIRGMVVCDECTVEECQVSVDSVVAPFYAPKTIDATLGEQFEFSLFLFPYEERMKIDIRCGGFKRAERSFESRRLWPGRVTINLRKIELLPSKGTETK